jgi:hypothetical protein
MTDSLIGAVDDLKIKIGELVATLQRDPNWRELQRLYQGLGVLEDLTGQPKTELAALLGIASTSDAPKIESWTFVKMNPLEAAKLYLRMIAPKRKAAPLDEIALALERGGLKVSSDALRIPLSRSTYEVLKVSEDTYGLLEFFPHVKRGGKKKGFTGEATESNGEQAQETEQTGGEEKAQAAAATQPE